jgi:hypothetical protein
MASPSWLEELRGQLERQALPPRYVERLLEELSDHLHDAQGEEKGMDAERACGPDTRMGEPSDLAPFIGGEYHKRYFSQRHPVVMFALMPILLLLGIWAGLLLLDIWAGLLLLVPVIGTVLGEAAEWPLGTLAERFICYGVIWLPVALTCVIFCRAARRRMGNWRWPLLTGATLAIFPGVSVSLAPSMLMIGFVPPVTVAAFIQFMLPLAIGGWYGWRGYRLQGA